MYVIVVYDLINHNIFLIRDPAGIKPLYFAETKFGWIFASQYNQISNIHGLNQISKSI